MKAYICFKCGFHTTIENRFKVCPVCNNNFSELNGKDNRIFLNFNGEQRIKWIENKLGHSIPNEFNIKRENYINQKINETQTQNIIQQSAEFNAKLVHGKAILEEQSRIAKCPSCGSANVSKIGVINRTISTHFLGLGSSKIGKTHKCNNCGTTW